MDWEHKAGGHGFKDIYLYPLTRDARQRLCGAGDGGELPMSEKNSVVSPEIYQLKVTLLGTRPPIWRRLLVPSDLNLAQLHDVLQVAMGWQDGHWHEFLAGGRRFGPLDPEDQFMADDVGDECKVRVGDLFGRTGAKALYTYDFGDTWEHSIVLEKRLQAAPNMIYPICTDGKLACPPEDCGGIPGFYDLLDALQDPAHEEHQELRDWVGGDYDPEVFSIEAVNRILTRLIPRRKSSKRARAVAG